jgi:type I protein arginine methyltransferase
MLDRTISAHTAGLAGWPRRMTWRLRQWLQSCLRAGLKAARHLIKSVPFLRNLLGDIHNSEEFTSLLAHERMLADPVRISSYYRAIREHVKPGDSVIDLGTGTGILSLFAAGRQPRVVHAIEHSPFIEIARKLSAANGIQCIRFFHGNSRDFELNEGADLIIHEQIGDELLTENLLANLLDLKRRVLKPGGRILPARFDLFLEPAQIRPTSRVPFLFEQELHGISFQSLREDPALAAFMGSDYQARLLEPDAVDHWLCQPEPILRIDLERLDRAEEVPRQLTARKRAIRAGRMSGLVLYFAVEFDADNRFDTSPLSQRTHWRSRLFRLPERHISAGDLIGFEFHLPNPADFSTWSVRFEASAD